MPSLLFAPVRQSLIPLLMHRLLGSLLLWFFSSIVTIPAVSAQACGAADGSGNTCKADTAIAPMNAGGGNPINTMTGNKYQREVDMPALPGVLGLEIVRHYNSELSAARMAPGIIGRGWKLSYETVLITSGNSLQIREADGTLHNFTCDALQTTRCESDDHTKGAIKKQIKPLQRDNTFRWLRSDGKVMLFNAVGNLVQIEAPTGEFVSLQYDARHLLMQITDPQGRSLRFQHLSRQAGEANLERFRGVQWIDSPVGRFHFSYGSILPKGATLEAKYSLANLVRVDFPTTYIEPTKTDQRATSDGKTSRPDRAARLYHYEDKLRPTYLTGISLISIDSKDGKGSKDSKSDIRRLSTFGYNADGKGILSTHSDDTYKVTLAYTGANSTTLTNSLGQTTVYRYTILAGQYRLLDVRGAGCALCGPANVRYGYDKLGRQIEVTTLTPSGAPLQSTNAELDYYGRPLRLTKTLYRDGKAGPTLLQTRYEYGRGIAGQPTLIAKPSVVPGKETTTRISYNAAGQPLQITEEGWAPAAGEFTAPNAPSTNAKSANVSTNALTNASPTTPHAMTRTTDLHYRVINGRSLLAEITEPQESTLQVSSIGTNASAKVTHIDYDRLGNFPIQIIAPGLRTTHFAAADEAGFTTAIDISDGINAPQRIQTTHNAYGQITSINQHGLVTRIDYLAHHHPNRLTRPDGSTLEALYDTSGRMTGLHDQDGNTVNRTLNSEDQLLISQLRSGAGSAPLDALTRYRYNARNQLDQLTDPAGAVTQANYDADTSLLTNTVDALQRQTTYQYDAAARLTSVIQNAQLPATDIAQRARTQLRYIDNTDAIAALSAANDATTRRIIDDFGRLLIIDSPDSGRQSAQYDAADRLTQTTDANGNQTR